MRASNKEFFRYLPISERERQWGLYVRAGGVECIAPREAYCHPEHPEGFVYSWNSGRTLQDYAMLFCTRGEGEFESKPSGPKKSVAGNAFLLFPGVWHRYRPLLSVGWDSYWVVFNGLEARLWARYRFVSPEEPVLNTGLDDLLMHSYRTMLDRLRTTPLGFEQLLAANVMEILAAALAAVRARGMGGMHELVCKAKSLLESRGDEIPTVEHLALSLGLSGSRFHRVFRKHTGLSPYQYYLQMRMERAKRMLHETKMGVKQIAATLAFESSSHFSRTFKRKTGTPPSRWRD
jgi:AraC-like DNA-binding protein